MTQKASATKAKAESEMPEIKASEGASGKSQVIDPRYLGFGAVKNHMSKAKTKGKRRRSNCAELLAEIRALPGKSQKEQGPQAAQAKWPGELICHLPVSLQKFRDPGECCSEPLRDQDRAVFPNRR